MKNTSKNINNSFPNDVDGDVLRRMAAHGFDFSKKHDIDFVVEFNEWPIKTETMSKILKYFIRHEIIDNNNGTGEIAGVINSLVSYNFVMNVQRELTDIAQINNGRCEVWGVLH